MTSSPPRSPIRDPESPIPSQASPATTSSRPQTPAREDGHLGFSPRSPIRRAEHPIPLSPPPMAIAIANRLNRNDVSAVAKVVGGGVRAGESGFGVAPGNIRRPGIRRAALGLRVAAFLLCMIAFSVMASDKTEGWAGDSFDRYKEFRYLVAVNVIAFVYSGFQVYERIHRRITKRHIIIGDSMRCYFDLSMDQILAYLLMSASSAAASRNELWVSRFGTDDFTRKANGSIAMSFLAFIVLALSSLISTYNLFTKLSVM